ncbi:unnamed protein product [Meloidogyne enterolobii]|uniref:Uncharacterized protein n=1 Tax=Meloidogyne enterolobii TaxID=390850 RepID=A0ACB0Y9Z5_MELEN
MPWKGVFRVVKIDGIYVTIVSCNAPSAIPKVVHINQLKKCFEDLPPIVTVPELSQEEEKAINGANSQESIKTTPMDENCSEENNSREPNSKRYNLRRNPKARRLSIE